MQLIVGNLIRIIGGLIILGSVLILLVGGIYGVVEARALDGPSQYGMLILVVKIFSAGFGVGFAILLLAKWLIRSAPPLEAADLPIGRNDRRS